MRKPTHRIVRSAHITPQLERDRRPQHIPQSDCDILMTCACQGSLSSSGRLTCVGKRDSAPAYTIFVAGPGIVEAMHKHVLICRRFLPMSRLELTHTGTVRRSLEMRSNIRQTGCPVHLVTVPFPACPQLTDIIVLFPSRRRAPH